MLFVSFLANGTSHEFCFQSFHQRYHVIDFFTSSVAVLTLFDFKRVLSVPSAFNLSRVAFARKYGCKGPKIDKPDFVDSATFPDVIMTFLQIQMERLRVRSHASRGKQRKQASWTGRACLMHGYSAPRSSRVKLAFLIMKHRGLAQVGKSRSIVERNTT